MTEAQKVVKEKKKRIYKRLPIEVGDRVKYLGNEFLSLKSGSLGEIVSIKEYNSTSPKKFYFFESINTFGNRMKYYARIEDIKLIRKALK